MKLTQRQELQQLDDKDLFHVVDVSNKSQSPQGSSFKSKLLSLVDYFRQKAITFTQQIRFIFSPIFITLNINEYVKTDLNKKLVSVSTIPFSDITGAPNSLPPNGLASGELTGSYPDPGLLQTAVTAKLLTGMPAFTNAPILQSDSILTAFSKTQGQINSTAQSVSLGEVFYVSLLAPIANDLQTRTQARGRIDRPFRTIQACINAVATANTILDRIVISGTFTENLNWSGLANITFQLENAIIIGNHTPTVSTNLTIEMNSNSLMRTNGNSAIITHSGGTIALKGGQFINNHTSSGVSTSNTSSILDGVRFVTNTSGAGFSSGLGSSLINNCKFRATSTGASIFLGQTNVMANASFFVNSGTGTAIDANNSDNSVFNNCYVRSQNGDAVGSTNGWYVTFNGGYLISNNAYALNADSNGSCTIVAKGTHFYGLNAVYRGFNSPARASILKFYDCLLQATTGQILVGNPAGVGTTCLLAGSRINKVLTALQTADINVIQDTYLDTTMQTPILTLLC